MPAKRKDHKGRVLKEGESYRKSDGRYMFRYISSDGKRQTIDEQDLNALREKEKK